VADFVGRNGDTGRIKLLDVGYGKGRTIPFIESKGVAGRIEFYGIDITTDRMKYSDDRWKLAIADAGKGFPFCSGAFDIVICEQVLEHLAHPENALREIGRVLRPGGLLILGVPTFPPGAKFFRSRITPHIYRLLNHSSTHIRAFSAGSIAAMVKRTQSFDVTDMRGFRMISGGALQFLEDYRWWWRLNSMLGRALPWLCTEVQILARKRAASQQPAK